MRKFFILSLIMLMISGCSGSGGSKTAIVEAFVGKPVDDVYKWCATLDDTKSCEVVYADNTDYEKDYVFEQSVEAGSKLEGNIVFKVSNGSISEVALPFISPELSMSDVEVWKVASGVLDVTYKYENSDTVEKNHVIRFEPSAHVTKTTPVVVTISSGKAEPESTSFEIKFGDYIGLSVAEFEAKAKELGLTANHQEKRDIHDSNVKIGNIVWHGSGVYEKGEVFNYGVCINSITIKPGEYTGLSEDEFIKIAKGMKLNPVRINNRDAYSATVDRGYVVTHGSGIYEEEEDFKYGLSLGPAYVESGNEGVRESVFLAYLEGMDLNGDRNTTYSSSVDAGRIVSYNYGRYSSGDYVTYYVSLGPETKYVDVPDFTGSSESELLGFLSENGILVESREEQTSLIPKGNVVYNDKGQMRAGDSVSYVISLGPAQQETAIIEAFDTVYDHVSHPGDYEHAEFDMQRYLFGRGFMNYEVVPVVLPGYEPGVLLSITIDGVELTDYPKSVPFNAEIVCQITDLLR